MVLYIPLVSRVQVDVLVVDQIPLEIGKPSGLDREVGGGRLEWSGSTKDRGTPGALSTVGRHVSCPRLLETRSRSGPRSHNFLE